MNASTSFDTKSQRNPKIFLAILLFVGANSTWSEAQSQPLERAKAAQAEWEKISQIGKLIQDPRTVRRDSEADLPVLAQLAGYRRYVDQVEKEYADQIDSDNSPQILPRFAFD